MPTLYITQHISHSTIHHRTSIHSLIQPFTQPSLIHPYSVIILPAIHILTKYPAPSTNITTHEEWNIEWSSSAKEPRNKNLFTYWIYNVDIFLKYTFLACYFYVLLWFSNFLKYTNTFVLFVQSNPSAYISEPWAEPSIHPTSHPSYRMSWVFRV